MFLRMHHFILRHSLLFIRQLLRIALDGHWRPPTAGAAFNVRCSAFSVYCVRSQQRLQRGAHVFAANQLDALPLQLRFAFFAE